MKTSKYNIIIPSIETDETILFNSLYGSLTVWDKKEIHIVNSYLSQPDSIELNHLPIKSILISQKYIIDDDVDEVAIIENRKRQGIEDGNRLDVIIMPTLDCNFDCVYCYESHRPSRMTDETETAIKRWLSSEMPNYKVVMLSWFGGEPLLGCERVISITNHAIKIAETSGIFCVTHMTSNGYLLTRANIQKVLEAGIYDFQITVDGTPETHDKLRVLKNGKKTFSRVFENINNLARSDERVKISLRVNFNQSNLHSIPRLLEMFPKDVRPHLRVVYEPIFGQCSMSATENLPAQEISEAMASYYKLARELGYDVILSGASGYTGKLVYCYAERQSQVIINYNGDVHKCSVSNFEPEARVGYIRDDGALVKEKNWNQWFSTDLFEEKCYSCVYLPLCMGGCRKMRSQLQNTGSYCTLVPTNSSYVLKQVALQGFGDLLTNNSDKGGDA
ncbi:MAG: SPASM domain-containing protein [Cyanobacteria bacterium SID2]|nr:SPASM domain-containing protein [Cyanobacteria bacterium SID2]MBP0003988.1 SPASM domain-containing protein [Cyanobacteria bacterium SBC]